MSSSYTYIGPDERVYPTLGLVVKPGDTATLDAKPDELWATSSSQKAADAVETLPAPTDQA